MLNIGKLDRRVNLERAAKVKRNGEVVSTWTALASVWAEIVQQSASEFLTGYGEAETGTVIFRVRYRPGITTADRVTCDGVAYDLKEITELGRRDGLELRGVAIS